MNDVVFARQLKRTYRHRLRAFRPVSGSGEEAVYTDVACALSRSAMTSAPTPPDRGYILPEALYRLALFTGPEVVLKLGDRLEVTDQTGRIYRGRCSDSFCYPSHTVTVFEVAEVEDGQDSRETGEGEDA